MGDCHGETYPYSACLDAAELRRLAAYHLAIEAWQASAWRMCGAEAATP